MENDKTISSPVEETRKCRVCGKKLPISMFDRFGRHGFHSACKRCEGKEVSEDARFKDISSKDLILELRARGYKGKLQQITVNEVVI